MLSNANMIEGRFARWQSARRRLAWIIGHLEAGHIIQITTHTKYTRYTKKHAAMFKANRSGLYVQRGKKWDCIDFSGISAFR